MVLVCVRDTREEDGGECVGDDDYDTHEIDAAVYD